MKLVKLPRPVLHDIQHDTYGTLYQRGADVHFEAVRCGPVHQTAVSEPDVCPFCFYSVAH
jgi:hypothetical protein